MKLLSSLSTVISTAFVLQLLLGQSIAIAWEPTKPIEFVIPAGTGGGADQMARLMAGIGDKRKQLIGAYFCQEYSYAAAALMNPSVVPHPDQSGLDQHTTRILMSLRAVGEGHISSIAFREGLVSDRAGLELMPEPPFAVAADAPIVSVAVRADELERDELEAIRQRGLPISTLSERDLDRISATEHSQGVIARMTNAGKPAA